MSKDTREEIISKLRDTFRQYGYDGASMSLLSEATGLSRSSLYHYFPEGKQQMAEESLKLIDDYFTTDLIPFLTGKASTEDKISYLVKELSNYYHSGKLGCIFNALGSTPNIGLFRGQLYDLLQSWIESMAFVAIENGLEKPVALQRAEQVVADIQGSLLLSNINDNSVAFERALERIPQLLR